MLSQHIRVSNTSENEIAKLNRSSIVVNIVPVAQIEITVFEKFTEIIWMKRFVSVQRN